MKDNKCLICNSEMRKNIVCYEDNSRGYICEKCGDYIVPETVYLSSLDSSYACTIPYELETVKKAIKSYLHSDKHCRCKSSDGECWMVSVNFYWDDAAVSEMNKGVEYVNLNVICKKELSSSKNPYLHSVAISSMI